MKIGDIISFLEKLAPPSLQEDYDNSGLLTGDREVEVNKTLICLDVTEDTIEEAIQEGCEMIIAHHPLIFGKINRLTGKNYVERCIIKAIKNNIALYAIHTNLDNVNGGVNSRICELLGLTNCSPLRPLKGQLKKLVTFIPVGNGHQENVRNAIFAAGAGTIGEYDCCSYNLEGLGTFRGGEKANPYVGKKGELHYEPELRVETIFPGYLQSAVIGALLRAHPYEEVAYDIYPLDNNDPRNGSGMVGDLPEPLAPMEFLSRVKETFRAEGIRYTLPPGKAVQRIAVCGGSGSFLLPDAISAGADMFITGDFKYHQFFDAEGKIIIADIGHFESEQFTIDLLYDKLKEKFPKFAVQKTKINTNPINYL